MPDLAGRRAICGDGAVGKKCVLNRYWNDDFSDDGPTIFEDWAGAAELDKYGLQVCKVSLSGYQFEAFDAINKASSRGPLCY